MTVTVTAAAIAEAIIIAACSAAAWAILEPSPEATSAGAPPLFVAAPLTVSVTITTAASTSTPQRWSPSGPRLIKLIGDPPHRRYPLVVYGD